MLTITVEELSTLASLRDELTDLLSQAGIELPLTQMAGGARSCGGGCKGCEGCKGPRAVLVLSESSISMEAQKTEEVS